MKDYNIHERIFNFVVKVINFLSRFPKTSTNLVFVNQCTRSVTSMGANDQEADGALTKKDFIHGFTLVRKEGKETIYWLRLIKHVNQARFKPEAADLIGEGGEIVAIISTIIKNTSQSKKKSK